MSYTCGNYPILQKQNLARGIYSFVVNAPEIARAAKAGQFANIAVSGFTLRRPISICDFDAKSGEVRFVFEERGKGTAQLAKLREGECLDILGPLGNGFDIPADGKIIVVGGGIGVPPLLGVTKRANAEAILGFRDITRVILEEDYQKSTNGAVTVCTDDGSYGFHGVVTQPLSEKLKSGGYSAVMACGPQPMLKAVIKTCEEYNVPCQVSLEQRMGCGVGACVVCSCMTVRNGQEFYSRVCKDGPVFKAEEVRFDG